MPDDAVRAVAELAASQHRAFTRSQRAELNFDRGRIATAKRLGWLDEPCPGGLVLAGAAPTWHQRLIVATLAARGHAVASHRAAARLHRLDGFERCDLIDVSIERGRRCLRTDGVVVHQVAALDACDIARVDRITCTRVARTLADLGSVVADPASLRRALTSGDGAPACAGCNSPLERLHRPGQRGTGGLLRQLASIPYEGRVPESWFEELTALCLRRRRPPRNEVTRQRAHNAVEVHHFGERPQTAGAGRWAGLSSGSARA